MSYQLKQKKRRRMKFGHGTSRVIQLPADPLHMSMFPLPRHEPVELSADTHRRWHGNLDVPICPSSIPGEVAPRRRQRRETRHLLAPSLSPHPPLHPPGPHPSIPHHRKKPFTLHHSAPDGSASHDPRTPPSPQAAPEHPRVTRHQSEDRRAGELGGPDSRSGG